ncbi:ubiquitin-associated domain-containing protein 2 isoform X2 [Varanus komodoensis]|uniref:ubiquitin-associated domain-containing protein 2 isoform X2 n=1 Tax=Varanus komodoensis TaxID=61221 RepID=UPI001CF7E7B2|nr:ubiquitin-associated domain-containing protein 2 isoform X2 [Varanus komodoensis]
MFTSTGSSGLYKAPLSKGLLIIPSTLSLLLTLLFQHHQKFFAYNLQAVKEEFQIWRLVCGRTVCLDLKDTFCSCLLIYNFRIFERRYGSRKFSLGPCVCAFCTILLLHSKSASDTNSRTVFHHKQDTGLYTGFAAFNFWILHLDCSFKWPEPSSEIRVGMGATVDIQREQRMELLDRQILMSQFAQIRRQRQQQGGMINWNRLFPPLRHRGNANYQDNHQAEHEVLPPVEVSEEQVARLMEMGFSRLDALEALRASNNDLNIATNFLLQHR